MFARHGIAAALFLIPMAPCSGADPVRVELDFGPVVADKSDIEVATVEGRAAMAAANEILSLQNVRFAIIESGYAGSHWQGSDAQAYPTFLWTFANGPQGRLPRAPDYVLRHEIGHGLFTRYLVPKTKADQYGSDAPDWLDEMAAIAFEGSQQVANRRRDARMDADGGRLLPLARLLSMTHPQYAGPVSSTTNGTVSLTAPTSRDTVVFYSTIRAFYDFLVERTGKPAIVAEAAAAFRRGESLDRWLLGMTGHDKRIGSINDLDVDFVAWLHRDPRYRLDDSVASTFSAK